MDVTRHLDEIEGLNMAVQEMQSLKNIADRQVEDWTVSEMIEMELLIPLHWIAIM